MHASRQASTTGTWQWVQLDAWVKLGCHSGGHNPDGVDVLKLTPTACLLHSTCLLVLLVLHVQVGTK